ncbi:MAG TPA: fibronectin type III domain-containing protein [Solirubrobacterales bacterium]|nr:fibronectin type III domain-containing protein [Solirubrobacterales bacterium]
MTQATRLSLLLGTVAAAFALAGPFAASAAADAPTVTIEPASSVTADSAHFSGEVNPSGWETCAFEYVTDAVFQNGRKEVQQLTINAIGGTYKLGFAGEETAPIPYPATAAEAQSALEGIAAIGTGGVSVAGGPLKNAPFAITFQAPGNVAELGIEPSGLFGISGGGLQTTVEGAAPGFAGAQSLPCGSSGPVAVEADASGLNPGIVYHLRLRASNPDGPGEAVAPTFTTETAPPQIVATSFSDTSDSSVTLSAQLNLGGAETTYHFEYLTLAEFEAATPGEEFADATATPESPATDADNQAADASATITGLDPSTPYRFRVVATNEKAPGGVAGPATGFKTLAVTGPETCPNAAVRAQQDSTFLPECRAYEIVNNPGLDLGDVNRVVYTSDDGDVVVYLSVVPGNDALGAGLNQITVARRTPSGWNLTSADPRALGPVAYSTGFIEVKAFSTDFSLEVVAATLPFIPSDIDGFNDYYLLDVGSGTSSLLSSDEDFIPGAMSGASQDLSSIFFVGSTGGVAGLYVSDGTHRELVSYYPNGDPIGSARLASPMYKRGLSIGGFGGFDTSPFVERGGAHSVSDDGSRVYFTDGGGQFFRDLDASSPHTVAVSESRRTGDGGGAHVASFLSASHDGSTAYIASNDPLTDAATPGGGIYRFDAATESLTQITPAVPAGGFGIGGAIVSDDQSHIYFTSHAALAGAAQEGDANMYVWTSGEGVRFIGSGGGALLRVTSDGRYMLFQASTSIGGAPNNGHQALYRYDYANDEVACVSCRPDGSPSQGDAYIDWQSHGEPGAPLIRNRALSFDGRVAFDSTDQIVAGDRNPAMDVYLYHDGTPSLLTPGGQEDSFVGDISDDGKNVTLLTRAPLLGVDRDAEEYDAYDVRVEGGFLEPPPPPAPCEGEACRGAGSGQSPAAPATTQNFVGAPNPKPCAKGKTRRNGRCVKPRKPRKHQSQKHKRAANANGRTGR